MTKSKHRFGLSSITARFKKKLKNDAQDETDFLEQSLDADQKAQFQALPEEHIEKLDGNHLAHLQSLSDENDAEQLDDANMANLKALPDDQPVEPFDASNMATLQALPDEHLVEQLNDSKDDENDEEEIESLLTKSDRAQVHTTQNEMSAPIKESEEDKPELTVVDKECSEDDAVLKQYLNATINDPESSEAEVDDAEQLSKDANELIDTQSQQVESDEASEEKIESSKKVETEDAIEDKIEDKSEVKNKERNFENSLQQGLSVQLKNLQYNGVTWSYRRIPVFVYVFNNEENTQINDGVKNVAHLMQCSESLEDKEMWVWVSSNIEECNQHSNHSPIHVCADCLSGLDYQGFSLLANERKFELVQGFEFKKFVARYSELYYTTESIKKWNEQLAIENAKREEGLVKCDNCQWEPDNKSYLLGEATFKAQVTLCVCCVTELPQLFVIIPDEISIQAKKARYKQLGHVAQNWDEVRTHLPVKWHQITYHLQVANMPSPLLFETIQNDEGVEVNTILSWPQSSRYIIEDALLTHVFDESLTVWGYNQVLSDVKP